MTNDTGRNTVTRLRPSRILLINSALAIFVTALLWYRALYESPEFTDVGASFQGSPNQGHAISLLPVPDMEKLVTQYKIFPPNKSDATQALDWIEKLLNVEYSNGQSWFLKAVLSRQIGDLKNSTIALGNAENLLVNRVGTLFDIAEQWHQLGNTDRSLNAYRKLLQASPKEVYRVVPRVLEMGIDTDPERVIDTILPEPVLIIVDKDYLPVRVFKILLDSDREKLADITWNRYSRILSNNDAAKSTYTNKLFHSNRIQRLVEVLASIHGSNIQATTINNGGFDHDISNLPLMWEIEKLSSVSYSRTASEDSGDGGGSLRVSFSKLTNVDFQHLSQKFLANQSGRYQITGRWKGDGISKHSEVYFALALSDIGELTKSSMRSGSWDWETFTIETDIDFAKNFSNQWLTVQLRRDRSITRTDEFEGVVWLDNIRVVRIEDR